MRLRHKRKKHCTVTGNVCLDIQHAHTASSCTEHQCPPPQYMNANNFLFDCLWVAKMPSNALLCWNILAHNNKSTLKVTPHTNQNELCCGVHHVCKTASRLLANLHTVCTLRTTCIQHGGKKHGQKHCQSAETSSTPMLWSCL